MTYLLSHLSKQEQQQENLPAPPHPHNHSSPVGVQMVPGFHVNANRLANMPKEQVEELRRMMQERLGRSVLPLPVDAEGRPIMPAGGDIDQQHLSMDIFSATKLGLVSVVKKKLEDAVAQGTAEELVRSRGK